MIAEWYEQYSLDLLRYARSRGLSLEDAEDVVSGVFLEALRAKPLDIAPKSWLFGRVQARIIDRWRSERRHPPVDSLEDISVEMQEYDDVGDALRTSLLCLSYRQRRAITLRYWGNLSLEETAVSMGCTVAAVKALRNKGVDRLRQIRDWSMYA